MLLDAIEIRDPELQDQYEYNSHRPIGRTDSGQLSVPNTGVTKTIKSLLFFLRDSSEKETVLDYLITNRGKAISLDGVSHYLFSDPTVSNLGPCSFELSIRVIEA